MNHIHVCTLGETLGLVWSEDPVGLETATTAHISIGGAESNVAIGIRRLGLNSHWIGRVGDDSLGRRIVRELRAEGVSLNAIVDSERPTALMLKERRSAGRTAVHYYRADSAGSRLTRQDVDAGMVAGSAVLHVSGITPSLSPSAEEAVSFAIATARASRRTVSFDVNHRSKLWRTGDAGELYRRIARDSDVVFAGQEEAALLVGATGTPEEAADRIAALGPREVVIKLGERGAHALISGEHFDSPGTPVHVIDSVGAGDAFVASYLYGLLVAWEPERRLAAANRAGGLACTVPGDWESLPRFEDLLVDEYADLVRR